MPGKPRDLNDCKSSVLDPGTDRGLLRAMAADGWEFGLHPPIHAKDDIDVVLWCDRTIEERLGMAVLDWRTESSCDRLRYPRFLTTLGEILAPRIATLNGHPGWVPAFRGLGSAYHQMRHGWPPAVSIHQVDEGIDTGPAYVREWLDARTVAPEQIEAELTRLRGRLFARVIDALARDEAKPIDMFLEPSGMTRGMPLAERRELERELRAGRALHVPGHLRAGSPRAGHSQDDTP